MKNNYIGKLCDIDMCLGNYYIIDNKVFELTDVFGNMDILSIDRTYEFRIGFLIYGRETVYYSEDHIMKLILENKFKECVELNNDLTNTSQYNALGLELLFRNYDNNQQEKQLPDRVLFNDKKKATTLLIDDKPTVVKSTKGDNYDRKFGFLLAYFQAYSGLTKTQANKYINDIVKDDKDDKEKS